MSVTSGTKTESGVGETIRVVIHALLIELVIRTFLFQPFNIQSGSMKETLLDGLLYFIDTPVERQRMSEYVGEEPCGSEGGCISRVKRWKETLPNGVSY